jgi:hypothetical protein
MLNYSAKGYVFRGQGQMADVGHLRVYFQDSKLERVFPYFGENSMLCGIRWLSGIDEIFRLTRRATAQASGAKVRNCGEKSGLGIQQL